jgi:hypothetical protein
VNRRGAGRARQRTPWLCLFLAAAGPACAAGGAHVIDDDAVETPGTCHLETWVTHYAPGRGLANAAPACTPSALPRLEIGAAVQTLWDSHNDTTLGPAVKLNLRPVTRGLGLALSGAAAWSLRSGRLETASAIVPLTVPVGQRLHLNFNSGWTYAHGAAHRHAVFFGAQAEFQLTRSFGLMTEAFGRDHGHPGAQAGLRWTPGGGKLDLDLMAGRRVDGVSRNAVTLGVTVRR